MIVFCLCFLFLFTKSHSSFCTSVAEEGRGPFDLETLAEGVNIFTKLILL